MNQIDELLAYARANGASDLHIVCGLSPIVRHIGVLKPIVEHPPLRQQDIEDMVTAMLRQEKIEDCSDSVDIDFGYVSADGHRQRVNIYRQQGKKGIALRILNSETPSFEMLHLPEVFKSIAGMPRGLILVTGPTGSGKTTTLSAMVDYINHHRHDHILTLEDPIEYLHQSHNCIVNQREIGVDCDSFAGALRSAMREDPDVILVGEMRDLETIAAAITAAETGHLVMSTLHTIGAAKTIDRIIDIFPPHQQQQIRIQLATVLKAVITQQLIAKADGSGRLAAFEVMLVNDAVANMIREGKTHQINSVLQTSVRQGMQSLDMDLAALVKKGAITMDAALDKCLVKEDLHRLLGVKAR